MFHTGWQTDWCTWWTSVKGEAIVCQTWADAAAAVKRTDQHGMMNRRAYAATAEAENPPERDMPFIKHVKWSIRKRGWTPIGGNHQSPAVVLPTMSSPADQAVGRALSHPMADCSGHCRRAQIPIRRTWVGEEEDEGAIKAILPPDSARPKWHVLDSKRIPGRRQVLYDPGLLA